MTDGLYHVTSRGVRRHPIYEDAIDYKRFLSLFRHVAKELTWTCHVRCQMPNHFHLVLETRDPNLSVGMQRLNSRYAQWFNWRHGYVGHAFETRFYSGVIESNAHFLEVSRYVPFGRNAASNRRHAVRFNWRHSYTGHLFESRFHCELVVTEAHLLEPARYIVLNPVRAGLCARPGEWPFSSYRRTLLPSEPFLESSRLRGPFGSDLPTARSRYEAFVAEGVDSGRVPVPGTRARPNQPKP